MYDIASALRRRAAAERLQGLQRAERASHRAADGAGTTDGVSRDDEVSGQVDIRPSASPAATIADLLRGGGSPLFFERR